MKKIRCLVFGLGSVGLYATKMLVSSGIQLDGVYSRTKFVGEDVGTITGVGAIGQKVLSVKDFKSTIHKADVALMFTTSHLSDLFSEAAECLSQGINVLTIAEDAMFPWNWSPNKANDLDRIAKLGNSSISGVGINDAVMVHLPSVVAAYVANVKRIDIDCVGNFGRLGAATLSSFPLGAPVEILAGEMNKIIQKPERSSICAQVADALISLSNLTCALMSSSTIPISANYDLHVESINQTVHRGTLSGFTEIIEARTVEEVSITVRLTGKLFEQGDEEYIVVDVVGDQSLRVKVEQLRSIESTAATAISRITDIIEAAPGFQTTDKLRAPKLTNLNTL